jgi:hypothetical protein
MYLWGIKKRLTMIVEYVPEAFTQHDASPRRQRESFGVQSD